MNGTKLFLGLLYLVVLYLQLSPAAAEQVKSIATTLLPISGVSDWLLKTVLVTLGYVLTYLLFAGVLEYTNPAPKTEKRKEGIKKELRLGLVALVANVTYATVWLWLVDPLLPYYGYYETHPFTLFSLLMNVLTYMFWFDTWFYWTHRLLHMRWWWRHVHHVHHQFIEPTAFAQDAVHPFESVLQGPMGHFLSCFFYPMHPITMAAFGFLTSLYAIAAHDGRAGDVNSHTRHHTHKNVNFGLYWPLWDWICGTRWSTKTPTPVSHHEE